MGNQQSWDATANHEHRFPCTCAPAHRRLVRHLLAHPDVLSVSVWDGGDEEAVKESTDEGAIIDSLESVHLSELVIHRREPLDYRINERVKVIPFQVDRDETVVDFSTFNDGLGIVESWFEAGQR